MRRNGARPVWSGGKDRGVKTRVLPITITGTGSCGYLQKDAGIHRHPRLPPGPAHRPGPSEGIEAESHPNGTVHARSAGRDAGGLASKMQNSLESSPNCGGASPQGTLSAAAGRRLPGSYGHRFRPAPVSWANLTPAVKFGPRSLFSLDRARPVSLFSGKTEKREMGGAYAPAIIMAVSLPARQGNHL